MNNHTPHARYVPWFLVQDVSTRARPTDSVRRRRARSNQGSRRLGGGEALGVGLKIVMGAQNAGMLRRSEVGRPRRTGVIIAPRASSQESRVLPAAAGLSMTYLLYMYRPPKSRWRREGRRSPWDLDLGADWADMDVSFRTGYGRMRILRCAFLARDGGWCWPVGRWKAGGFPGSGHEWEKTRPGHVYAGCVHFQARSYRFLREDRGHGHGTSEPLPVGWPGRVAGR